MSKYEPLRMYLEGIPNSISERTFTFAELEAILGFKLPASAHNYQAWWANQSDYEGRPQAEAWMTADWRVEEAGLNDKWVQLRRCTWPQRTKSTISSINSPLAPSKHIQEISVKPTMTKRGFVANKDGMHLKIGEHEFKLITIIEPIRHEDGLLAKFMPQGEYDNKDNLALSRYGQGPFIKFNILKRYTASGVYAIVVDYELRYVGECENLPQRFNMGYGNISPRNCFTGGQDTNCRINNLIYQAISTCCQVSLWFHETSDYKRIEAKLRSTVPTEWNRV